MRQQDRWPSFVRARDRSLAVVVLVCAAATFGSLAVGWSAAPDGMAWPPAGVGLALLVLFGYDVWPAVFAGILCAGVAYSGADSARLLVAAAAVAEAYAGAWLVNQWACGAGALGRTRSFVRFAIGGGLIAAAFGPAFGVPALALIDQLAAGSVWKLAVQWWLSDSVSTLVLASAILLWRSPSDESCPARGVAEPIALAGALGLAWTAAFVGHLPIAATGMPLEVLAIPPLVWTAYRFGARPAALATAGLLIVSVAATAAGHGPFGAVLDADARVSIHLFVGIVAATVLTLATVTAERRAAESRLLQLVRTDGLTGLTNYRGAIDALQAEVSRGMRHGMPFAVLFLDLDRLKDINDSYGHLTGNRALMRLARAIEANCRANDVAARLGGDEFCLVLPGADHQTAALVAERVVRLLESDAAFPRLSVSVGVASYPRDGATAEDLLGAADALLYGAKARRATSPRVAAESALHAGMPA